MNKTLAVMVALGNRQDNGIYADAFYRELKENGAHIVGDYLYADSPNCNLNKRWPTVAANHPITKQILFMIFIPVIIC